MGSQLRGQALMILGAPRSGTSAIANAFRKLGFYLGEDEDFPEPREGNPQGIFERKEILQFNGKCSDELYLRHDRPDLSSMTEHPAFPRLVDEASSILRSQYSSHDRWGWKEPQTTLLAPIYQAALQRDAVRPSYILAVRSPAEVIKSQNQIMEKAELNREAPLGPRAYRRWLAYTLKSLLFTKGAPRAMIVYHQLVADARTILAASLNSIAGDDFGNDRMLDDAISSINPGLHRNRVEDDVPEDAPQCVHELWELCCEIGKDPEGLCSGDFDHRIRKIESDFNLLSTCFGDPEPPHCSILFYQDRKVYSSPVMATGQWNRVEIEIPVQPQSALLGMLYPMPANVYLRNAQWVSGTATIRAVGQTIESQEGDAQRFSVVSAPPQISLTTPKSAGPYRLTMEVFIEMNIFIAMDASARQSHIIRALESQLSAAQNQLAKLQSFRSR